MSHYNSAATSNMFDVEITRHAKFKIHMEVHRINDSPISKFVPMKILFFFIFCAV